MENCGEKFQFPNPTSRSKNNYPKLIWSRPSAFHSVGGFFGEGMYRYSYDMQSGTSHYRKSDGTIESWRSPQRRGEKHFQENYISIWKSNRQKNSKLNWRWEHPCASIMIESFLPASCSIESAFASPSFYCISKPDSHHRRTGQKLIGWPSNDDHKNETKKLFAIKNDNKSVI